MAEEKPLALDPRTGADPTTGIVPLDPPPTTDIRSPQYDPIASAAENRKNLEELYKRYISGPITPQVAQTLHTIFSLMPVIGPKRSDPSGKVAEFFAGMAIPQTPTDLAIMAALGPIEKIGFPLAKTTAEARPALKSVLDYLTRTAAMGGVGGITKAATTKDLSPDELKESVRGGAYSQIPLPKTTMGSKTIEGIIQGLVAGATGLGLTGLSRRFSKDITPLTAQGKQYLKERFGKYWANQITMDVKSLAPHVSNYDDLKLLLNDYDVKRIGDEIYAPLRQEVSNIPGFKVGFPYIIKMPEPIGRIGLPAGFLSGGPLGQPLPQVVVDLIPNEAVRIINSAKGRPLSGDDAMELIFMLNKTARNARDNTVGDKVREFANEIEHNFISSLNAVQRPDLAQIFRDNSMEYLKLNNLARAFQANRMGVFPEGGGMNPMEWSKMLTKSYEYVPPELFPSTWQAVTFRTMTPGGGAFQVEPLSSARAYLPTRMTHTSWSMFHPTPRVVIPTTTAPTAPLRPGEMPWVPTGPEPEGWFRSYLRRAFPQTTISGVESVIDRIKREQQQRQQQHP